MGASWEAKIYINGKNHSSLQVKNDTPLQEIRDSLNINDDKHFISRNDGFIERETDFTAKNVWKNDEEKGGYKIDLMTREYFDSFQSDTADTVDTVDLYFNMFRNKAIKYDPNMTLDRIMEIGNYNNGNIFAEKKYYLLSKTNIKIEDFEGLEAKDIVKNENNGKRIDIVDSNYYKKFQVIEHLKELESKNNFDWLEQTEFFMKVKNLCGEEVTTGIINELYNERREGNRKGNKEYIKRFINLLIEDNKSNILNTTYEKSSKGDF